MMNKFTYLTIAISALLASIRQWKYTVRIGLTHRVGSDLCSGRSEATSAICLLIGWIGWNII